MTFDPGLREYGWSTPDPTQAHEYVYPAILELLPDRKPLSILDAGCGNGYVAGKLSEAGYQVSGFDISDDGIQIALKSYPGVHFEIHSIYDDLTELFDPVDVVIASEVIEHLYFPQRFLDNIYKVIKPGGYLILTTLYHGYLKNLILSLLNLWDHHFTVDWEGGHIKFFSSKTLESMLIEYGFKNVIFKNAGRLPFLWKSMVCRAQRS